MKVLHLSRLYPPMIVGGAEKSVSIIAETEAAAGLKVAAACIDPNGPSRSVRKGVEVFRLPHCAPFWPLDWPAQSRVRRWYYKALLQFNHRFADLVGDVLDEFQPDILHTHSLSDVSTLVWERAHKRSIPIIHTLRDTSLICPNTGLSHNGQECKTRHFKCLATTFRNDQRQKAIRSVVGISRAILEAHEEFGYFRHIPQRFRHVIWNPVSDADLIEREKRQREPNTDLVVGYLGRVSFEKGVHNLIQACRELPESGWRLMIAGEADRSLAPFVEMANGLPIEFTGFVNSREFFQKIDLLVVPSILREALSRVTIEAFAAGVPVLGARSGGIPELIGAGNDDWLFDAGNVHDLSQKILRKMKGGTKDTNLRAHCQRVLKDVTPLNVFHRYTRIYESVLANE